MPVDRDLYKSSFTEKQIPAWRCPTCEIGQLKLVAVEDRETAKSRIAQSEHHQESEPDWYEGRFASVFCCGNSTCNDTVVALGTTSVVFDYDNDGQMVGESHYRPRFFSPGLKMIVIPTSCPENVVGELMRSFELALGDPGSGVNRVRAAVENFLTHQGVKRTAVNRLRKRILLPLHNRIMIYKDAQPELADNLLATKIVGNAGSHPGDIALEDYFDALDLFEHVLHEVYDKRSASLRRIREQIVQRKKPRGAP